LDPRYRTFYIFEKDNSKGIWVENSEKLAKAMKKDLGLPDKIAKEIEEGKIQFTIETKYYGGGEAENYLNYYMTEDAKTTDKELDKYDFSKWLNNKYQDIVSKLMEEYDSLLSDESVKETIEINEYDFLEDGTMFRG
jgi:hypothetical protein